MGVYPSVSVIIPCYNSRETLGRAIQSALRQEHANLDIVVVDDASSDNITDLVTAYGAQVRHIRLEQNRGPAHARNCGVSASRGKFVAFLDADDEWLPHHIASQVGWMERIPDAGFSFCNMWNTHLEGQWVNLFDRHADMFDLLDRELVGDGVYLVKRHLDAAILGGNFIGTSGVIMRRTFWDRVGGFEESLRGPEDIHLWVRMARRCPALMLTVPGEVRHVRREGLTMQGERWHREELKALDLLGGELSSSPLSQRLLRVRRRDVYFALIMCYGHQSQRAAAWRAFMSARANHAADAAVIAALVAAIGGKRSVDTFDRMRRLRRRFLKRDR